MVIQSPSYICTYIQYIMQSNAIANIIKIIIVIITIMMMTTVMMIVII